MVKLAHFSVKEYLVLSQIMEGAARGYSIQEIDANVRIARDCLSYILYFTEDIPKPTIYEGSKFRSDFPLIRYARQNWQEHARIGGQINEEAMVDLIMELFTSEGTAYSSWCLRYFDDEELELLLYFASKIGLLGVARRLITMGVDVNAISGYYGNALCVASANGHTMIVKLLLEMGAYPNSLKYGSIDGSAVCCASRAGYDAIVRLLLDAGAEVGPEEHNCDLSALHAAASQGRVSTVAMLISTGMDVNLYNARKRFRYLSYAIHRATQSGHDKVVKQLVEAGANTDSKTAALYMASRWGFDETVRVLLPTGADLNQSRNLANSLRAAARGGKATTVKLLLDAGADVNLGGSWNEDSFDQWVYRQKHPAVLEVLNLLLGAGAEIIGAEEMIKELRNDKIEPGDMMELRVVKELNLAFESEDESASEDEID